MAEPDEQGRRRDRNIGPRVRYDRPAAPMEDVAAAGAPLKQVIRRVIDRKGRVKTVEYPDPYVGPQQVLVRNHYSLISSGTEFGTLQKTPTELVRQTLADPWMRNAVKQTVFSAGLAQTARRVWQEMISPREIGYSGAGEILEVGAQVTGFAPGDHVAYAATGHAEIVAPSINHLVKVPAGVELRHAAFVTVGAIAIQALRRAEVQFGETVAIVGLGLVGQIAAMIAKAAGCVVIGIDIDPKRTELAVRNGADLGLDATQDLEKKVADATHKHGVDATLVCASSRSDTVINQSMEITRKQGRVVLVGYVKLDIHPKEFLYKEIDLRYSRAYGPGSYHRGYEKGRVDYPFSYVRWTEQRNLNELVRLIDSGGIKLEPLIGETFTVERAQHAFDALRSGTLPSVAALIDYEAAKPLERRRTLALHQRPKKTGALGIGLIGVGNHTLASHLPALRSMKGVEIRGLASATGKMAATVAKSVGAKTVTTDVGAIFDDDETDAVMICSGHAHHAEHLLRGLESGKALFVEKPLVTRRDDLKAVLDKLGALDPDSIAPIVLGLNRRYAPLVEKMRGLLDGQVDSVTYHVTPHRIPADHWTLDPVDGGGRLIAEAEHFIDLCHLLIGREPRSVTARPLGEAPEDLRTLVNYSLTLDYPGAVAHLVCNESGSAGHPREHLTALAKGRVAVLEDFERLTVHGTKKRTFKGRRDMGHGEQLKQFIAMLRGEPNRLISWPESLNATLCLFAAEESLRSRRTIELADFRHSLAADDGANESASQAPRLEGNEPEEDEAATIEEGEPSP